MLLCSLWAAVPVRAQNHTFTDSTGQTFSAQVLEVKNDAIVLRRANGKVYSVDLATLSPADRKFLADWKAKSSETQVATATTDSDIAVKISVEDAKPGDANLMVARVTITNQEDCCDFKGLKGTLILVGQNAGSANPYKVLALEKFSGDLPACGKYEFSGQPFNPADDSSSSQPSYPYSGYVFVLQNSGGNIIQFHHSESFVKDGNAALKLRVGLTFAGPGPRVIRRFRLVNYPESHRAMAGKKSPATNWSSGKARGF